MCYEKRPKYLGAFTPAYKTHIMYFIKLLKLLLLSSPCHREKFHGQKSFRKTKSFWSHWCHKEHPARTEVTSPGWCHLSLRAAVAGDARLGSWSSPHPSDTSGLAQPGGTHSTDKPLWLLLPGYHEKHHRANPALLVTRSQWGGLREERGPVTRKGPHKSTQEGQGHGRSLTCRLLGAQRRRQHRQAFSTTPLFWFVLFLTLFILQAWLSPI